MIRRGAPEGRRSVPHGQLVRLVLGIVLVLVLLTGYSLFGIVTAGSRTGEGVVVTDRRIDLVVTMDFEPEPYHLERLRRLGTVAGRYEGDESKVRLLRVEEEDLRQLSRITWISHLDVLDG